MAETNLDFWEELSERVAEINAREPTEEPKQDDFIYYTPYPNNAPQTTNTFFSSFEELQDRVTQLERMLQSLSEGVQNCAMKTDELVERVDHLETRDEYVDVSLDELGDYIILANDRLDSLEDGVDVIEHRLADLIDNSVPLTHNG